MIKRTKHNTRIESTESWRRMLAAVPVPNHAASISHTASSANAAGPLRITVPRKKSRFMRPPFNWLIRPPATRSITLDRIGEQVWRLCDGRRSVEAIVDAFAQAHRLTFHEARVSVTNYIRMLAERGALAIVMDKPGGLDHLTASTESGT